MDHTHAGANNIDRTYDNGLIDNGLIDNGLIDNGLIDNVYQLSANFVCTVLTLAYHKH